GFVLAALAGAVISSLASMLNSASTIFTMDLYKRIVNPKASQAVLVNLGRAMTVVFVIIACLMAPMLAQERFKGVFNYIQEFQGLFSPGILAAFVFGFVVRRAPAAAAISGMVACPIIYSAMKWPVGWTLRARYTFESAKTTAAQAFAAADATPSALDRVLAYFMDMAFLDRMGITFILVLLVMGVVTAIKPLAQPVTMPVNQDFDMRPSRSVFTLGLVVIAATVALYVIFW
ncbi:MAG: hypothetical protein JXA69_01490, partial [Phycisphaerae bacterium]|nr:hypothetical protein [Phycisphaerae bacterium]